MSKKEIAAGTIFIGILLIIIIIISLWLAWIQFNRFLFWFDVAFAPLSFIGLIIFVIAFFTVDEWDREPWYIFGAIAGIIFLITILTISGTYNQGYSENAIKTKAELENQLQTYTLILSVYTGQFQIEVQGMVMNEFNKALCDAVPETPCQQVIEIYNAYQELIGWKESADTIARVWRD